MLLDDHWKQQLDDFRTDFHRLRDEISKVIFGQTEILNDTLICRTRSIGSFHGSHFRTQTGYLTREQLLGRMSRNSVAVSSCSVNELVDVTKLR